MARTFDIAGISAERGIARLHCIRYLSVERINLCANLVDEPGPALVTILSHQTIQIPFIVADNGLNPLTRGVAWLPHRRNRGCKSLLIKVYRLHNILRRGLFFRFKFTDLG